MIVTIQANKNWNEKTLLKEQNFELLQSFIREVANRGISINKHTRIIVDFQVKPGNIAVYSYPPPMWVRSMKTMHVAKLHDKQWLAYRDQLQRYRKSGGIKVRSQDPVTGEIKKEKLSESGIIIG